MVSTLARMTDDAKECTRCRETKPLDAFRLRKVKGGKQRRETRCLDCEREEKRDAERRRREADPEAYRATQRVRMQEAREADPEAYRQRQAVVQRAWTAGLTVEESEALRARPCAICGAEAPEGGHQVDKDRATGTVRGALCRDCLRGLRAFKDSWERLNAALDYLGSDDRSQSASEQTM